MSTMVTSASSRAPHADGKRRLRPTAVVRELILDAARSCFAESGYSGTTTRQIAKRAEVVENLIFKHFGNKSALFEAAVVQPFRTALETFTARWSVSSTGPHAGERTAREYVEALYDLLDGHAELLLAIMVDRRGAQPLLPLMEQLERVAKAETEAQGWHGVDIGVLARLHFGMVAFNAAFGETLYPRTAQGPSRERIVAEMAACMVHGTAHRPAARS
jgi:AcrR family transcriptional regulator